MNQTYFKDLETNFVKNRLERGRLDRAVRKIFRAGKINNEGAALGCVYAALKAGDTDELPTAAADALSALLPEDAEKVVKKLSKRFVQGELEASILWNLGITAPQRAQPSPTLSEFSYIAADILNPEAGEHVLNAGGSREFMEALFAAQPDTAYSEWEDSRQNFEMEILRVSLLDFREVNFPVVLSAGEYTKAFVIPAYEEWLTAQIADTPDPLFEGIDVSESSRGWNQIAEVFRTLRPGGMMTAVIPAGALVSSRDEPVRRFFTDHGYLKMVVALPHALTSATPYSSLLVLGKIAGGHVRFVNASTIERTEQNRWTSEEWCKAVLGAVHTTGTYSADVSTARIRKDSYNFFPVNYMLAQRYSHIVPLGDVAESVLRGSQLKRDVLDDYVTEKITPVRCVTQRDLGDRIIQSENVTALCLSSIPENLNTHTVPDHAVILSKQSTPSSAVVEKEDGITLIALDNLYVIEVNEDKLDPYYLQAYLSSDMGRSALKSVSSGTQMLNLSQANLLRLPIPLPSIEKQKEIGSKYRQLAYDRIDLQKKADMKEDAMKEIWRDELPPAENDEDETDKGEI